MLKKHNQYIKDLISARTEEVIQKISRTNKRYRELTAAIDEVQRELTDINSRRRRKIWWTAMKRLIANRKPS
jgi:septation ring formation regulator EzrA